jgi:hypothetical protein
MIQGSVMMRLQVGWSGVGRQWTSERRQLDGSSKSVINIFPAHGCKTRAGLADGRLVSHHRPRTRNCPPSPDRTAVVRFDRSVMPISAITQVNRCTVHGLGTGKRFYRREWRR